MFRRRWCRRRPDAAERGAQLPAAESPSACAIARLKHERVHVVRCDIENLIKFSQGFGKTTKSDIGKRVLAEQVDVARVEPLGFVKVGFAPVPLASPPRDIG